MDINLQINPSFEAVFLINGKLSESGKVVYGSNEVVYITVLPLDAYILPYTVKMVGERIKSNGDLASCYNLGESNYYLKLLPRYNYVYNVGAIKGKAGLGIVEKFFNYVLKRKLALARECLSEDLSNSIGDEDLSAFFDGFSDVIKSGDKDGEYYLIGKGSKGILFWFEVVDGAINNIVEKG